MEVSGLHTLAALPLVLTRSITDYSEYGLWGNKLKKNIRYPHYFLPSMSHNFPTFCIFTSTNCSCISYCVTVLVGTSKLLTL